MFKLRTVCFVISIHWLAACTSDVNPPLPSSPIARADGGAAAADAGAPAGATTLLLRPSKSSTVSVSDDDALVTMSNPEDNSISTFRTSDNARLSKVTTGGEPWAVVFHPDRKTVFVANRSDATVVKVSAANTASPTVGAPVAVGSEPTALALSPTGAKLFVAEWAQGRVSVIQTSTMAVVGHITNVRNPRALAVTNNGDSNDNDETLVVTEFFGEPVAGREAQDDGRRGRVRLFNVGTLAASGSIEFQPIDSGFIPTGTDAGTVMTSPNQLNGVVVRGAHLYVSSVSASPRPPPRFDGNVFPVVYVGHLPTATEVRGLSGTLNLARKVFDAPNPTSQLRLALGDLSDIDFTGNEVGYVVSKAADAVQRVVFASNGTVIGSPQGLQIDLFPSCQNPVGIATNVAGSRAYVNCWITRRLGVLDLTSQSLLTAVQSSDLPAMGTNAEAVRRGARFYFTGRGRWSSGGQGWSSCGSCHPDGLSDNITWSFAAGPRQTTSMDGTYAKTGARAQRILNWTGIFDELHDFENNTRGVSGGLGAVTEAAPDGGACGNTATEVRRPVATSGTLPGGLAQPIKEVQDATGGCTKDWDEMDEFVKTIRPPRALELDHDSVARGAALFGSSTATESNGNCNKCHGGPGFTLSRRFFTPSSSTNTALTSGGLTGAQAAALDPTTADGGAAIGPPQVKCVLRSVGTFGMPDGDGGVDTTIERKADGTRAQGAGGYNIPSLYGLALGAPYLHHGGAATLIDLFTDPRWSAHLRAGNPTFLSPGTADIAMKVQDLVNYLLTIDAHADEVTPPSGADTCPATFP
jgi:DNA-binding beta-propeller fold protein YncE